MKLILALLQVLPSVIEFWKELAAAQRRAKYSEAHREVDEDLANYLRRTYGGVHEIGKPGGEGTVSGEDSESDPNR